MRTANLLHSIIGLTWVTLTLVILLFIAVPQIHHTSDTVEETNIALCGMGFPYSPRFTSDSLTTLLSRGKQLFKENCAQCHARNMVDQLTGPALGGIEERWSAFPRADLFRWIRSSQEMIAEKHPRAVLLWAEFQPTIMNDFPNLTDQDIEALLLFIETTY